MQTIDNYTMGRGFIADLRGFPDVDRPAPEPEVFNHFRLSLRRDILSFIIVGCAQMEPYCVEPYCRGVAVLKQDAKDLTQEEASFKQDLIDLADTLNYKEPLVQLTATDIVDIYHYLLDNPHDTDLIAERWAETCSRYNAGEANESVNDCLTEYEATYEEHQEMLVQQHALFIDQRLGRGKARLYESCLRSFFKEVGDFHGTRYHESHPDRCVIHDMDLIMKRAIATPEDYRRAEEEGLSVALKSMRAILESYKRAEEEESLDNEHSKDRSLIRAPPLRPEDFQQAEEEGYIRNARSKPRSPSRATSLQSRPTSHTGSVDTKSSRQASPSTPKPRNSGKLSDLLRGTQQFTSMTRSSSLNSPWARPKGVRLSWTEDKIPLMASSKRGRRSSPDARKPTGKDTRDPGPSSYREDSSNIPEYYLRNPSLKDRQSALLRDTTRASYDRGTAILRDDSSPRRGDLDGRQLTPTSDEWERVGK